MHIVLSVILFVSCIILLRAEDVAKEKTIVFFGAAQVGKTNLLNLLTGEDHKVGDGNVDVGAFDLKEYSPVTHQGVTYRFIDTCGLNAPSWAANVPPKEALKRLINLSDSLADGIALLVMVKPLGIILPHEESNFAIAKALFPNIKKVLVVSKGESLTDKFLTDPTNHLLYTSNEKFQFEAFTYSGNPGISENTLLEAAYAPIRQMTKKRIWDFIHREAMDDNTPPGNTDYFLSSIVRAWDAFVLGLGHAEWAFSPGVGDFASNLSRIGLSAEEVSEILGTIGKRMNSFVNTVGEMLRDGMNRKFVHLFTDDFGHGPFDL